MRWSIFVLGLGLVLLLSLPSVHGKIFKWTDASGKVHFTDDISSVPPQYHEQVEERTSTAPGTPRLRPAQPSGSQFPPLASSAEPADKPYTVPLRRVGNAMLVEAMLGGYVRTNLLVDTGASLTVIPTAVARQLALNLDAAAVIALQSASGTFVAPLTRVSSITVGGALVRDVEVVVHDISPDGHTGLLGMSFLDHFQVTMNSAAQTLILTTPRAAPGHTLYGGYPGSWWHRRFRFYRGQIALLNERLSRQVSPRLTKALRYFQTELTNLEQKASWAAVPRNLRY